MDTKDLHFAICYLCYDNFKRNVISWQYHIFETNK